jgi:Flp pilus assembly protein TadG
VRKQLGPERWGAAAVELAVLLPLLTFLFVITVDFARIFYYAQVIENCARNGAIYESNLTTAQSPYASLQNAALADAAGLSPQPTGMTRQAIPTFRLRSPGSSRRSAAFRVYRAA